MNKYKKAWDTIFDGILPMPDLTKDDEQLLWESMEVVEELLEKETSKNPIIQDNIDTEIYNCPNCGEEVRSINRWVLDNYPYHVDSGKPNYCAECGQRLNWEVQNNGTKE